MFSIASSRDLLRTQELMLTKNLRLQTFINASTSDVVATTSVEALAMGKWVIAARHACNDFISAFANCLIYDTPAQFSAHLLHADATDPQPLTRDERYQLSWEAATERCDRQPARLCSLTQDGVACRRRSCMQSMSTASGATAKRQRTYPCAPWHDGDNQFWPCTSCPQLVYPSESERGRSICG